MFLVRAWALPGTFLVAAGLALLCWNNELSATRLPSFEFPVRVVRLAVVMAGLLLLRPTIDRFRDVSLVSPRPLWLLDLGRFAVTAAAFATVGVVQLGRGQFEVATPFSALGWLLALGAVTATLLPQYYWVVTLVAGFLWIQASLIPPNEADVSPGLSLLVVGVGAAAYVAANAWVRARALTRGMVGGS